MSDERNTRRRNLELALLVVALIGLGILVKPYLSTYIAARTAEPTQPRIDLGDLSAGDYVEVRLPASRVFILRDFDEQVYIFSIPFSEFAYWLPEFDWSRPAIPCADFGPDEKEGKLVADGKFRCRRPDHGEFFRYEHAWSYAGENLGYRTSDLKSAEHEIVDNTVLLSRWK